MKQLQVYGAERYRAVGDVHGYVRVGWRCYGVVWRGRWRWRASWRWWAPWAEHTVLGLVGGCGFASGGPSWEREREPERTLGWAMAWEREREGGAWST
jgi:hypothetical protein